jgi:hypothetical protein
MTNAELEAYQTLKVISASLRQLNETLTLQAEILSGINDTLAQMLMQKGEHNE